MRRRQALALIAAVQAVAGNALAQPTDWTDAEVNGMRYKILPPRAYNAGRKYPVVLYLHQLDMGDYPQGLLKQVNAWFNTASFRTRHACIVVMPLLDQTTDKSGRQINFGGAREGHAGEDNAIAALRQVTDHDSVDRARIYVTGNSMGGMGTWQLLLAYNRLTGTKGRIFAAGLPLAGTHQTADPAQAARLLTQVPIWAIHGAGDTVVSPNWDRTMARLLTRHPTFRYTEDPTLGHDVWDRYYTRPAVWDWLFAQGG